MGGLPAQQVLGDGTGGRLVPGEQESEDAFVLLDGQGPGGQVQVAPDGLGDVADGNTLIADGVEDRARGGLLKGQPVKDRSVLDVDGGPAAGSVADVAGDPRGPGQDAVLWFGSFDPETVSTSGRPSPGYRHDKYGY